MHRNSAIRVMAMGVACMLLAACAGNHAYQYHGRLVSYRTGEPLKDVTVYAGPETGDPGHQAKTNGAGEFAGSFSMPAPAGFGGHLRDLDRIDVHYLTPRGWVILHHTLGPEDQDLTRKPAVIDLGTLPVPE